MRRSILTAVLVLAVTVVTSSFASAELRFGPWAHYAPYYYPPVIECMGSALAPMDFLPRYESPNPPRPSYDPGDPCRTPPGRAAKIIKK